MLTQRFPPHRGAAARRFRHLAERFAGAFTVYVIRAGEPAPRPEAVTRDWPLTTHDLRHYAVGKDRATVPAKIKKRTPVRQFLRLRQAFPFVHLLDDGGPGYRSQALAIARELVREGEVTTLFSSYQPWTDHLVARELKKEFPHLRWIADFRDLPVDPIRRDVWWPALQRRWGRGIIRRADEVWCVSEGQAAQLRGWHPEVRVHRNALRHLPPAVSSPVSERFTVVYTGSLYPRLQSIAPLVRALRDGFAAGWLVPEKIRLVYRGKDAELWREWTRTLPEECLDTADYVDTAAAEELQLNAQILLLLTWSAPGYYGVLTAKLYDYLATGRPVLALVNGPGDRELEGIIRGAAAGAVVGEKEQGEMGEWLRRRYVEWSEGDSLTWRVNKEFLIDFMDGQQLTPFDQDGAAHGA